jgi:hypothetical protein
MVNVLDDDIGVLSNDNLWCQLRFHVVDDYEISPSILDHLAKTRTNQFRFPNNYNPNLSLPNGLHVVLPIMFLILSNSSNVRGSVVLRQFSNS